MKGIYWIQQFKSILGSL